LLWAQQFATISAASSSGISNATRATLDTAEIAVWTRRLRCRHRYAAWPAWSLALCHNQVQFGWKGFGLSRSPFYLANRVPAKPFRSLF
jgi:hypothetical protein